MSENKPDGLRALSSATVVLLLALLASVFSDGLAGALGLIAVILALVALWNIAPNLRS